MLKLTFGVSLAVMSMTACSIAEINNSDEVPNQTAEQQEDHQSEDQGEELGTEQDDSIDSNEEMEENEKEDAMELSLTVQEKDEYERISLAELASVAEGTFDVDAVNRTANLSIWSKDMYFIEEVPVVQVNGVHEEAEHVSFITSEEDAYVSVSFVEDFLSEDVERNGNDMTVRIDEEKIMQWEDPREDFQHHDMTVDEMIEYLSFLDSPIDGAEVSTVESHLPGAQRDYRNGYHEGIDWYDYTTEVVIDTTTPILAQAEGEVIRADHDFEEYPSHEVRNHDLDLAADAGFTPEYILDRLRGQQVWVQYDGGVMIRFAHLDRIPEGLKTGDHVDEETVIGYVGNSGTSGALDGDGSGLHLHQDLLIYDTLFYEPFSLKETRTIIQALWGTP